MSNVEQLPVKARETGPAVTLIGTDLPESYLDEAEPSPMMLTASEWWLRLKPHLMEGNVEKVMTAPWIVIIANDFMFHEKIPKLFPHNLGAKDWFSDPHAREEHAMRNGSLQGAYLMLAARALGLDCGPMSGFNQDGVDLEFFADKDETHHWRSNFLCAIGHGDDSTIFERSPRLAFDEACKIL